MSAYNHSNSDTVKCRKLPNTLIYSLVPLDFRLNPGFAFSALCRFLILFICIGLFSGMNALAQTAGITVGSDSGYPGATVTIPVNFTPGAADVSTVQFDLMFASTLSSGTISTGPAALSAGKSASSNVITGGVRVLIFGLNQNVIGSGVIANVQMNISPSAPLGAISVNISNIVASDPYANQAMVVGIAGSVVVVAPPDTTPPVISAVSSSSILSSGVTINWTTNEAADTQVEYGPTTSFGENTTLDDAMVTLHFQAINGLAAGTLYYYRVMSRDGAGNLAISDTYTFTTMEEVDLTPPDISSVSSSNITSTSVTITWTTDEASDSQIDYGLKPNQYDESTPLSSSMATSHSQTITGLMPDTRYHCQVKSRDAAGNLGTSSNFSFRTLESGVPTMISAVSVSGISSASATINWNTDKPADSKVVYWPEGERSKKAVLRDLVMEHSLTLNRLKEDKVYHFTVHSVDSEGNETVAPEDMFSTTQASGSILAFSQFASGSDELGANTMVGLGLANLGSESATITFTASEDDGNLTIGQDIVNPVVSELNPGEQLPIINWEVFGSGLLSHRSNSWVKLDSSNADTNGFFLIFDSGLNLMDGANFADTKLKDFIFPEIQTDGYNKISIINNNSEKADVTIELMNGNGTVRSSVEHMIKKNGALTADLFDDLFVDIEPNAGNYVRVSSTIGVQSLLVMRQKSGDISTLVGQDITTGDTTLYSPQYAIGGPWRTTLSVINLDSVTGMVMFRLVGEDGIQIGSTRAIAIPANGKLYIDDPRFFVTSNPEVVVTGYVEIASDGIRLAGSTVFGDINRQTSCSALELISSLQNSVVFSHVASNDMYYTGIAILNPNTTGAVVTMELYAADGRLLRRKNEFIGAKQRICRVLTQYFTLLEGASQTDGYVRLTSGTPFASFALFGTKTYSVLSAIPPLVIQ